MNRILVLGGTTEGLAIARALGPEHTYSLAGIGRLPEGLACQVRVGGYGGAEGLAGYLAAQGITLLLDATHPYAARISANAAQAARATGTPYWAVRRPGWHAGAGDDWREADDWAGIVTALAPFQRPLFTLGREPLEHLESIPAHQYWTLRALQAGPAHPRCEMLAARGPFTLEGERELFSRLRIDVLVSKNSGSLATEPKLQVARERGLPVVILRRPVLPAADQTFADPQALLQALSHFAALRLFTTPGASG